MFASGSKTKNVVIKSAEAARTPKSPHTVRSARLSSSAAVASNSAKNSAGGNVQARSKFTEHKQMPPLRTRSLRLDQPASARTNLPVNGGSNVRATPSSFAAKKSATTAATASQQAATATAAARARFWNRQQSKLIVETKTTKIIEKEQTHLAELGIQTNEPEILNHELLVGDIKLLLPSKSVAAEIDRQREEARKKSLLKAHRKFEEHAEKEEEHLTDLKEFLEKATVTKRNRKPRLTLEVDKKLIHSMDEMLSKEVPKAESMTDIKSRIKKKEQELLNLFDTVENMQIYSNAN